MTLEFAEVGICGHVGGTDFHGVQFLFGAIVLAGWAGALLQVFCSGAGTKAVAGVFCFRVQVAHCTDGLTFAIAAAIGAIIAAFYEVTFAFPATPLAAIGATDLTVTVGDAYALSLLTLFVLCTIDGIAAFQADSTALAAVITDLLALGEEVSTLFRTFLFVRLVAIVLTHR